MYNVYLYLCQQKNRLFSALLLENLLLSVLYYFLTDFKCLQCVLLHAARCTDRVHVIHAFQNKMWRPSGPKYLLLSFNPLYANDVYRRHKLVNA